MHAGKSVHMHELCLVRTHDEYGMNKSYCQNVCMYRLVSMYNQILSRASRVICAMDNLMHALRVVLKFAPSNQSRPEKVQFVV